MKKKVTLAYFSPGGSTKEIAERFAAAVSGEARHIDLMQDGLSEVEAFDAHDLLVVALPVFAGRIPSVCSNMLRRLKCSGTPAVAIAVYGNRDFDDALLEMSDILQEGEFHVVGAAAFIARHSIFPGVAKNRPDESDQKKITQFAKACMEKIEAGGSDGQPLNIPGNHPYKGVVSMPIRPTGKKSTCTGCNVCVKLCPVGAIRKDTSTKTDKTKCITCMACVYHCPAGSRGFHTPLYKIAKGSFEKKCAERLEPTVIV